MLWTRTDNGEVCQPRRGTEHVSLPPFYRRKVSLLENCRKLSLNFNCE